MVKDYMQNKGLQYIPRYIIVLAVFLTLPWIITSCATSSKTSIAPAEKAPAVTGTTTAETSPAVKPPAEKPLSEQEKTEQILSSIRTAMQRGDFTRALDLFSQLNKDVAASGDMQRMKATILAASGNIAEARSTLQNILTANAEDQESLLLLANIEGLAGNTKEQKQLLEKLVSINPKNTQALTSLGDVAYAAKTYKLAEAYYKKALSIDPNNSEALLGKGKVDRYNRNPQAAEEAFNRVISMNPDWALPLQERARLYRENNFLREALADLDKAKELAPHDYWVAMDRGNVLLDLGRKEEALKEYERAIGINGDY
ncbi:MAG TPA: tetratricopeptide repeat protein, partial [Treponema sp.]|nr:tetratricopeptide repeat protein [Treponema sp.]